jgi:nucleoside-diphosphate-sugar epimerase
VKRAFVTGGSGFVGGRLIRALVAKGIAVRALARSDHASGLVRATGAEPVRGDLGDRARMQDAMMGCDTVFHAAAHVEQHGKLETFLEITVRGTENTLAAAKAAGISRFVHVSTEAVIADGKPIIRADEKRPLPTRPVGPYAISKGLAEQAVIVASGPGFDTVVIRPRFVWGLGDTSLVPKIADAVKRGTFAWVGGGRYLTSTCHIANVVEGALLAAERGAPRQIYFLTDGEPVEFRAFITDLLATQGLDAGSRTVPRWVASMIASITSWMKNPPVTRTALALIAHEVTVDDTKARSELGYLGAMSREAGLAEMRAANTAT